jgi:pyruvate ferredoxin oxidoreductase alpha subunit
VSGRLLTGNVAAAWAARLANVDYVPAFPITPQTEIIETISRWTDGGEMRARMVTLESEHSMLTAAGAAAATGVRVFTATSSQGLLYAMEMIYAVPGWRVPLVLVNVSRGIASPVTLESDHTDIMAARDSGFLQLHCSTCQEVLDSVLLAYRLAEHERVRLPAIVNLDGFYLSFTREAVDLPDEETVRQFLEPYDPENISFRASQPLSQAVAVLGGSQYSYFRYEMHLAAMNAIEVYREIAAEFADLFGRSYKAIETYRTEDANIVFVMLGSFATKAKDAVDRLRDCGARVGLVRPRLLRPFPEDDIRRAVAGKQAVIVVDQNLSMGKGGVMHAEIASVLYGTADAPAVLISFIGGLGGRDICAEEFYEMVAIAERAVATGETPPPRLLFTEDELLEIRKLQAIAHVEREALRQ